jgi:NarL family two-component system response regulator YdfI
MGEVVIRVLIATASEATRSWFAALPASASGLAIIGIVPWDAGLRDQVQELAPDIVVVDAADSEPETIVGSLGSIRDLAVEIVLLVSGDDWQASPVAMIRYGVRAVIPQQPTIEELDATARAVVAGLVVLDRRLLESAAAPLSAAERIDRTHSASPFGLQPLTPREIEVLAAVAEGYGNKQIAARLDISEHTVKTHLAAIFEKLEVSNRTEAVLAGARLGLVLL